MGKETCHLSVHIHVAFCCQHKVRSPDAKRGQALKNHLFAWLPSLFAYTSTNGLCQTAAAITPEMTDTHVRVTWGGFCNTPIQSLLSNFWKPAQLQFSLSAFTWRPWLKEPCPRFPPRAAASGHAHPRSEQGAHAGLWWGICQPTHFVETYGTICQPVCWVWFNYCISTANQSLLFRQIFWACCIRGAREAQVSVRARGVVGICCPHSASMDAILDNKRNDHLKFSCMCQPKIGTLKSLFLYVSRAAKWVLSAAPLPSLPQLGSPFILSFKPLGEYHLLMNSNLYCLCYVVSFWTW